MQKYIGITLGPISRIASYADDTKGLWATSYLFSYIGKMVVEDLSNKGRTFIKPHVTKEMFGISNGVGYFPDQYIFEAKDDDFKNLCTNCDAILNNLGVVIANRLKIDASDVIKYIKETIKIYIIEKELHDSDDVVRVMDGYINSMECRDIYQTQQTQNYLAQFFNNVIDSSMTIDAFSGSKWKLFNTVIEYSAFEIFNNTTESKDRKNLINKIENGERIEELKPYHKYIAIVSADGDHIGKAFGALKEKSGVLNRALFEYNIKVAIIIANYGGQAVYQGGDDLLFFAPICNGDKNIFHLVDEINVLFNTTIGTPCEIFSETLKDIIPSLSFGISISYYKHPMFEAKELSDELLTKAKNDGRNRICAQIRKHSGQTTALSFDKRDQIMYDKSLKLIQYGFQLGKADNFLHSTTHWLIAHKDILTYILGSDESTNKVDMLKNYFDNTFNESIHKTTVIDEFFATLRDYLTTDPKETVVDDLHAILRFVELLNSTRE